MKSAVRNLIVAATVHLAVGCAAPTTMGEAESLITFTPIIDLITDRKVEATATHLLDWAAVKMIDPALVTNGTLEVHYCEEHFPTTSIAFANLTTAIEKYNQIPGVGFNMKLVAEPNTKNHPDLTTFVQPANAIYVDYDEFADDNTYASTNWFDCDAAVGIAPRKCSRAHIYANSAHYSSDTNSATSPSVGVFMHELAHAFGEIHIDGSDDKPVTDSESMIYDRLTIHGPKNDADDPRGSNIPAASLVFLRNYYSDWSSGLDDDELTVHQVMSIADLTTGDQVEFTPAKDFTNGAKSLLDGLNETRWRWKTEPAGGYFVTCADSNKPVFLARHSDLSTNRTNKTYSMAFSVSTVAAPTSSQFTQVALRTNLGSANSTGPLGLNVGFVSDFRQIDWKKELTVGAADVGVATSGPTAMTTRKLTFAVDVDNTIAERREQNDSWTVTVCLYAESDTNCSASCVQ